MADDLRDRIAAKAREIGFDTVGFSGIEISTRDQERLDAFVAGGEHGDMGWMAENMDRRRSPAGLWDGVKSVIVLGTNYGPHRDPMMKLQFTTRGNISAYAQNRDYHDLVKKRLKQLARWMVETTGCELKVFVDTAPVLEKPLAAQTRVGWQGKHSNIVSREFGSWLFLGEIYCSLDLEADDPREDRCGKCTACHDVCPTDAFPAPYQVDARRCISYLTIEHKGHIDREFRKPMGNRVYGCDDCLAVCPWNKFAQRTPHPEFYPRAELTAPRLADFLDMDDAGFRQFFTASPVKRIGRDRFLRNVLIALANSHQPGLEGRITPLLEDASPLVRAMAVWALSQLSESDGFARLRSIHLPQECDEDVRAEWQMSDQV